MKQNKNSKKTRVEMLRMVLDTPDNKNLYPGDEKYLRALSRRLKESSEEEHPEKYVRFDGKKEDTDYLKPRVTVYPKRRKEEKKKIAVVSPKKFITIDAEKKNIQIKGEDIFEIEKVRKKEKKFIKVKVKPKEIEKQKEPEKVKEDSPKEELLEWKAIDAEKPKVENKEKKEEGWKIADSGEYVVDKKIKEKKKKSEHFIEVKKINKKEKILPIKKVKLKEDEGVFEEVTVEKELEHDKIDDKIKIEVFKDLKTIDDETAIALYDVGFTSLESLESALINDLSYITGIKKSKIKKIKKEISKKSNSEKVKKNTILYKKELVQENFNDEEILSFKEKPVQVESLDVGDTAEWKITADELIDEGKISVDKIKIDSFKEVKNIDEKTAILLYDNGYTSVDSLKKATEDELKKIKGLKRKKIKEIMREINEKLDESVKAKSIEIDLAANAELTKDQLQIDMDTMDEEIKLTDSLVELEDNSEWIPIPEKDADKDEKKQFINGNLKKDEVSYDAKIEVFKDLKTIDDETAIILYDSGIKSIKDLKDTSVKNLSKINGIKKSLAKKIKKESDKYETIEDIIKEDDEIKLVDDESVSEEEINAVDEQISTHFKTIDVEEDVEDLEEFKSTESEEMIIDNFKDIKSIDEKIAELLIENGIYSIEDLMEKTIKELTKIKGIRKKIAKEIKKEVDSIKKEKPKTKKSEKKKEKKKKSKAKRGKQYYLSGKNNDFPVFDPEQFIEENKIYRYGEYVLYEKEIETTSNKRRIVRFFSKEEPDKAYAIKLPEGYEVRENGNGVPYLKKKQ